MTTSHIEVERTFSGVSHYMGESLFPCYISEFFNLGVFVCLFVLVCFFQSSFRFTAKLRGRYRFFLYTPLPPHMHSFSHYQHPQSGKIDKLALTDHYHPESIWTTWFTLGLSFRIIHSMGLDKCIMKYIHHYSITQNSFTAL